MKKEIIDYIEDLEWREQELYKLQKQFKELKDAFDFNLGAIENIRKENHKLEEKIDKTIEYIKEHNIIAVNKEYLPSGIERCCSAELLEILEANNEQ